MMIEIPDLSKENYENPPFGLTKSYLIKEWWRSGLINESNKLQFAKEVGITKQNLYAMLAHLFKNDQISNYKTNGTPKQSKKLPKYERKSA